MIRMRINILRGNRGGETLATYCMFEKGKPMIQRGKREEQRRDQCGRKEGEREEEGVSQTDKVVVVCVWCVKIPVQV